MIIGRRITVLLNSFLDQCVPPILRDSVIFRFAAKLVFKNAPYSIEEFKDQAFEMPPSEFRRFYEETQLRVHQGDTDLSPGSAAAVLSSIDQGPVLEVGCGRGWLAQQIAANHQTFATDISLRGSYVSLSHSGFTAVEADAATIPFLDNAFPTVVCTHVLEHVTDFQRTLSELRRVCAGRLIIVLPKQRPYRVTFSPHLHFFPYRFSVLAYTGTQNLVSLQLVGGDWLLIEDHSATK